MDKTYAKIEFEEGLKDPTILIERYLKTMDLTQNGQVPFKLFPRQREFIRNLSNYRFNIAEKPRQAGVSTCTAAYLAVAALLSNPKKPETIIILANKLALAKEFLSKIRVYLSQFPAHLWGGRYNKNKFVDGHILGKGAFDKITLVNGVQIIAKATSPDSLRGYTPTILVIDEAAFAPQGAEMYTAASASTATGGKIIIISTPNGHDELYYKIHNLAVTGKNDYKLTKFRWYEDPRYNKDLKWEIYDENDDLIEKPEKLFTEESYAEMFKLGYKPTSSWYKKMSASLNWDKKAIARELDVKFEGSGGNVVASEALEYHNSKFVCEPLSYESFEKSMWVWHRPLENGRYVMGVDVSAGNSDDYSAIQIIDVDNGEQMAEFKAKIRPEELAKIVIEYGIKYNHATVVVDSTGGYGSIVLLELQKQNYKNIYYREENLSVKNKRRNEIGERIPGLTITVSNRPKIIAKYIAYVEKYAIRIKSIRLIKENETFIWINGRADHMRGHNDDAIMAIAMAIYIMDLEFLTPKKVNIIKQQMTDYVLAKGF